MSTTRGNPSRMLGSNLRAGMIPGGMAHVLGLGRRKSRKQQATFSMEDVRRAADATMVKHGFTAQLPSHFERSVMPEPNGTGIPP